MRWVAPCAALLTLLVGTGCGPPTLDTSNGAELMQSISSITEPLEPEQRERFEESFEYLTDSTGLGSDPTWNDELARTATPLDGLTAEQIVNQAWQTRIDRIDGRLAELEQLRRDSADDLELLAGIDIVEALVYPATPGFAERPVVELTVANYSGRHLFAVELEAALRHPEELEPRAMERVHRPFGSGFAPGVETSFRIELTDSDWKHLAEADSGVLFTCDVVQAVGRGNRVLASSTFNTVQRELSALLREQLDRLEAAGPGATLGPGP